MGFQVGFPALKGPAQIDYWFPATAYRYFDAFSESLWGVPDGTLVAIACFLGMDA